MRHATDALARQISRAARRIGEAVASDVAHGPEPGGLGVESVQVSFGITLTGGVQAMFTAQTESSAQVSITLTRRPAATEPAPDQGAAPA